MPGWRILLLFIFISPAWVLADTHRLVSTPGKMRMRGNIIEAACYVDPRYWLNLMISQPEIFPVNLKKYLRMISAFICWDVPLGILNIRGVCFNAPILPFPAHPIVTILII